MRISVTGLSSLAAMGLLVALAGCHEKKEEKTSQPETRSAEMKTKPTPAGDVAPEFKDPMKAADADMRKVLEELGKLGGKPIAQCTPEEARKQPTPADAVMAVLKMEEKPTTPLAMAKVENRKIPGAAGQVGARIYTPKTDTKGPLPVVAYWHGGGFVIADLDVYDASARAIAKNADAIVVSLDYRHAPEHKFPAAYDDAVAGYQWVAANAASFGGDPKRIAVAGESAGGNLAMNVAIAARDKDLAIPLHELLIYPVAQTSESTKSYHDWQFAKPLDKANMTWFVQQYTRTPDDLKDTRIDLVHANLARLPKTTIINAEIDPLKSDGDLLTKALENAKVDVNQKTYEGMTHEFFGMGAVVGDAKDAEGFAGDRLKSAFKK
jgi:acetyl esterase/lipase